MTLREKLKGNRQLWGLVAAIAACMFFILLVGIRYITSLRTSLLGQAKSNVMTMTTQQQQTIDNFILEDRERLYSFAEYMALSRSDDIAEIQQKLRAYRLIDAYYSVVNLDTGIFCGSTTSEIGQLSADELKVYRSFSGSGVRNAYKSMYTSDMMFGYYECFTFADGVRGVFQKSYDSSRISREFSLSFYGGRGFSYVVSQDGDILLRSQDMISGQPYTNILEVITDGGNIDDISSEAIEEFMQDLRGQTMGNRIFRARGEFLYTYVPLNSVSGWYLVSIVPVAAITEETDQILLDSRNALVLLAAVLAIFTLTVLILWRTHRKIKGMDIELDYQDQMFRMLSNCLSDNGDDVYLMIDAATHKVDYVSPNIERVLGIPAEDVLNDLRAFGMATYLSGAGIDYRAVSCMAPGVSMRPMETERVNRRTGEQKWFLETVYCSAIQDSNKIIVYISDRTQERQTQDRMTEALKMAQAANTAKSTFLSSISHDIRTPMNAIMGLVTLLREEAGDNETVLDYTQRIDAASQHLLGLINDVLDINKIESGSATLNIGDFSLSDIVDELNTIIRPQAAAKEQEFDIFVSDLVHENLQGDKLRINQILINILSNAVKYTPAGGRIQMMVEELPEAAENYSRIRWTVRDNGLGMSEEYQKVIFEPFSREGTVYMNQIQGTGLGMAITKSLVDLLGGTIHVKSEPGQGSTFMVEMVLRVQEREEDEQFWKEHRVQRMIVADDDVDVCLSVVKAMAKTGVTVDYATDGQTMVEMARAARKRGEAYDLLLLDWKMPDVDGLKTARLLRKQYPDKIPILLFTAYGWNEIEKDAAELGINHFLSKPFFMSSFRDAIRRVMGDQRKEQTAEDNVVEGRSILVVDDIEVNRMILTKILTTLGGKCTTAENGQEAVERFTASPPGTYDVILMDVQMPVMSGYEATEAIRASGRPDAETISIIAMTANAFTDDIRRAVESGMDAHVAKPVQLDKLKTTIRTVLERKGTL